METKLSRHDQHLKSSVSKPKKGKRHKKPV